MLAQLQQRRSRRVEDYAEFARLAHATQGGVTLAAWQAMGHGERLLLSLGVSRFIDEHNAEVERMARTGTQARPKAGSDGFTLAPEGVVKPDPTPGT